MIPIVIHDIITTYNLHIFMTKYPPEVTGVIGAGTDFSLSVTSTQPDQLGLSSANERTVESKDVQPPGMENAAAGLLAVAEAILIETPSREPDLPPGEEFWFKTDQYAYGETHFVRPGSTNKV